MRLVGFLFLFLGALHSAATEAPRVLRVLALGDSLTEGYGVALTQAYPAILEKELQKRFDSNLTQISVINAGIGGSTSASGERRLRWHLRAKPDVLILALGANDMLRGLAPQTTEQNLRKTIRLAQEHQIPVVLAGMKVPPNYGRRYRREFEALFSRVAHDLKIPLIPFLLEGVAGQREFNQDDGIHPNEKGHELIAKEVVAPHLVSILKKEIENKK